MSNIIPISIAKYTEEYTNISRQLDALEIALLELASYEAELKKRKLNLENQRRELETRALKAIFKEET